MVRAYQSLCCEMLRTAFLDHILTLQQLLAEYERMLSQFHPAYLSQLRVNQKTSRGDTDKSIVTLSMLSVMVLCIQGVLGQ